MVPYKNRRIDHAKKVKVYRCLNRKGRVFSILQNGLVVGHVDIEKDILILKDAVFHVNEKGQERVRRNKRKEVHAFIEGYYKDDITEIPLAFSYGVRYNPYRDDGFIIKGTDHQHYIVKSSECVYSRWDETISHALFCNGEVMVDGPVDSDYLIFKKH